MQLLYASSSFCFIHVRECDVGPLEWFTSEGVELPKGVGTKENAGDNWRWVHLMDPFGVNWFRGIVEPPQGPHFTHAYLPHKSREDPIMTNEIVGHRMTKAGISFVRINTM